MIHPFQKNRKQLLIYALVWLIFTIIQTLLMVFKFNIDPISAISDSLIYNSIFAVFATVTWYTTYLNSSSTKDLISFFTQNIIAGALIIYIWVLLSNNLCLQLIEDEDYLKLAKQSVFWRYVMGVFYYILTSLVFALLHYSEGVQIELEQINKFEKTAIESELKALKSQLNPHFLFNSLNSISYLTLSDAFKAQEMLVKLSNYIRYAIDKNSKHYTSLEEELNNAEAYIDIEKVRFEDKINFIKKTDKSLLKAQVPHMILQPLLENAIKYGVYESDEVVDIKLDCYLENKLIKLKVENDYSDSKQHKGEGIGLKNIEDRLKLLYSSENLLSVSKTDKTFTVIVKIPYFEQSKNQDNE